MEGEERCSQVEPASGQRTVLDGQAAGLDGQLAGLGQREAGMRLRVGELLHGLGGRYRELGFSTFGVYVSERLSRKRGWARDTRVVARRATE